MTQKRVSDLSAQSPRSVLWAFVLLAVLGGVIALALSGLLIGEIGDWGLALFVAYLLAVAAPLVVLSLRRLNDMGWPQLLVLVYLLPILGVMLLVPLLFMPGAASAAAHRQRRLNLRTAQKQCALAKQEARVASERAAAAIHALTAARERAAELESGRGALLGRVGDAQLHEFWISVPGYEGPVCGTRARVAQHGDLHSVSDVTGTTKGGLGAAVVGGLALGPVGAVVGSNVGRKTTVQTTVRTVDTRSYAIEVEGPGFLYCTESSDVHSLRAFRDLVNARGSANEDVMGLLESQHALVRSREVEAQEAAATSEHASRQLLDCDLQLRDIRLSGGRAHQGELPSAAPNAPDAGWYPDPSGRHEHRYWTGSVWTAAVADDGEASEDSSALACPSPSA